MKPQPRMTAEARRIQHRQWQKDYKQRQKIKNPGFKVERSEESKAAESLRVSRMRGGRFAREVDRAVASGRRLLAMASLAVKNMNPQQNEYGITVVERPR